MSVFKYLTILAECIEMAVSEVFVCLKCVVWCVNWFGLIKTKSVAAWWLSG